jgi:acetyltransferase
MDISIGFTDPSQNIISRYPRALDAIFKPNSVALIGAKDDFGSVGRTILTNLIGAPFKGKIYPVNPKRQEVLGLLCYPSISDVPEPVDLAIIVTPAATVPGLMRECVKAKVKSCIVISAGFKELGEEGLKLEQEAIGIAQKAGMPVIGPNCLGVMNPQFGLNATFARGMALPGNVAFISQSGAMCTSVLDWSFQENIGFSSFVSIGSMADVDWGDIIDYLGGDPATHSILMYMETIGNPRKFLSSVREIAIEKPIIVIKAGRSAEAAHAAASHTGSLAGSDEIFDAALQRVGVLRVNSIAELFQMASVLARQPRPKGPKLAIVTNAGGPGVLATDTAIMKGAELSVVEGKTLEDLNQVLPSAWSHSNPIDILGDAKPERYAKTMEILIKDSSADGVLVILSPQDMTDPTATAEALSTFTNFNDKPILASWMGGTSVAKGIQILNQVNIPTFEYPDDAAATFAAMWRYSRNIQELYETPKDPIDFHPELNEKKEEMRTLVQTSEKTLLDEFESKQLLAAYGIPIVETVIAATEEEAVKAAEKMGFPCVLKLFSKTITHKTEVGGVKLNLKDSSQIRSAFQEIKTNVEQKAGKEHFQGVTVQKMIRLPEGYELIIGSTVDPQFGPTLLFGSGGQLVEVYKDRALGFPPLNRSLATFLMEKTKIYEALKGVRGRKAVNLEQLEEILVSFSQMIVENPRIKECDINPLLASPEGCIALDARVVLFEQDEELPTLAIRPYPTQYIKISALKNGEKLLIRPIAPEDEPLLVDFHKELSENSVRQRFFEFVSLDKRVAHERLMRICFNDFDREIALVALIDKKIIGVIRISRISTSSEAQMTMLILDAFHNLGLGTELLREGLSIAKKENLTTIFAQILDENGGMIKICEKAGFEIQASSSPHILTARKDLLA